MTDRELDLDALEKVARAALNDAGGSDWRLGGDGHGYHWLDLGFGTSHDVSAWNADDCAHIATFDPPTVLKLIALARPKAGGVVTDAMVNAAWNKSKDLRMTGLPTQMREVLKAALASEDVEKAAAWLEETVADYCDPDSAFRAAELLRRLALIEPSAGKDFGADLSQLQPAESGTGPQPHAIRARLQRARDGLQPLTLQGEQYIWMPVANAINAIDAALSSDAQSVRPDGGEG